MSRKNDWCSHHQKAATHETTLGILCDDCYATLNHILDVGTRPKTKVWQATWSYPHIPRDDRDDGNINPIFSTMEKAMQFLEEIARDDWKNVNSPITFPGLQWDDQFSWRRVGTLDDESFDGNTYLAQEVEVR